MLQSGGLQNGGGAGTGIFGCTEGQLAVCFLLLSGWVFGGDVLAWGVPGPVAGLQYHQPPPPGEAAANRCGREKYR